MIIKNNRTKNFLKRTKINKNYEIIKIRII